MGRKSKEELAKAKRVKTANDWRRKNARRYTIAYSLASYSDVIQKLDSVPAKNQYIAKLIREDMKRED